MKLIAKAIPAALAFFAVALFVLYLMALPAHAQTMTKEPLQAKPGFDDCAPGHYGVQWPRSVHREATRGNAGWYGYAWCMNTRGEPTYVARACAHGECVSMSQVFATVGALLSEAVGKDKREIARAYAKANPLDYHCHIYPPGPAPALPARLVGKVPAADTPRGRACAELLSMMHADWPMLEFAAPAPSPPLPPPVTYTRFVKNNACTTAQLAAGTCTRPVYRYENGVRSTTPVVGERAVVGTACLEPVLASTGTSGWSLYAPDFKQGYLTLCDKP